MSRFEGNLKAASGDAIEDRDLLAIIGDMGDERLERSEMIAQYLSTAAGWQDTAHKLGGAFASAPRPTGTRLSGGKEQ